MTLLPRVDDAAIFLDVRRRSEPVVVVVVIPPRTLHLIKGHARYHPLQQVELKKQTIAIYVSV